ncbi:MAG: imidazole glycerol phosphate synthase subunit HisF [Abditibacteriota bacterium]|nr:imidazole glycerol phosphate synthase subunit HisF [Abditibacteriota bacterium]
MEFKKIVPCLDMKDGRVVKGVNFVDFKDVDDPVERAKFYEEQGADEIVFLDIAATVENRNTRVELAGRVAKNLHVPFTVGGGIRTLEDFEKLFEAGASKCSVNSAAVFNPDLVKDAADRFGSERICVAIDVALFEGCTDKWEVYTHGGTRKTGIDAVEWAKKCADNGAGSLLPTSVDTDGMKTGYDLGITRAIKEATGLPVIASGGAGTLEHIYDALTVGKADAALVASVVHFNILPIPEIKAYLKEKGIPVK